MSRSTRNSQDAAYFVPCSMASSHGSTGSSSPVPLSQSDVVGANSSTVAVTSAPDQPSPEFLATVVQAVKQALAADQAPVFPSKSSWNFWFGGLCCQLARDLVFIWWRVWPGFGLTGFGFADCRFGFFISIVCGSVIFVVR